jgi:hypothetical protein
MLQGDGRMRQKNEGGDTVLAGLVVPIVLVFGTQFPVGKNKKGSKTNAKINRPCRKPLTTTVRSANHCG